MPDEKKTSVAPAAAAPKKTTWASIASQPAKLTSRVSFFLLAVYISNNWKTYVLNTYNFLDHTYNFQPQKEGPRYATSSNGARKTQFGREYLGFAE